MDDESIGRRIADYRKLRGLTQEALAQLTGVSYSIVQKIEQGTREASQAVVAAVAPVLNVDPSTLTGQPYDRDGLRPDVIHEHMPLLRRVLAYRDLPPDLDATPRPVSQLADDAARIAILGQHGRYTEMAERLPSLLLEALTVHHGHELTEPERESVLSTLTGLFFGAHVVTHQTGYEDLSTIAEDRVWWVAQLSSDPVMGTFADWIRTASLMRLGAYDTGLSLLDRARSELDPGSRQDDGALRMVGTLHLRSAIMAARSRRGEDARGHIAEARQIAGHLSGDTDNDWRNLAFGTSNVEVHAVAAAVEVGDGPAALTLNDGLHFPERTLQRLPTRVSHHLIDLSRAQLWQGQRDAALASLHAAKDLAPQQTRHHPTTREVTRVLVRSHYRANEPLARFHAWIGDTEL